MFLKIAYEIFSMDESDAIVLQICNLTSADIAF